MSIQPIAVPYFFVRPSAPPPWPGVVVVAEGNGISPQLLRVCQRLAARGYAVAAPDYFWRLGGSDPNIAMEQIAQLEMAGPLQDVASCIDTLRTQGATKIGVTGFCMGGRITYLAATTGLLIDAAAPFYGGGIASELGTPTCPLLAFFGGIDPWITSDDIRAVEAHHPGQVMVYPDAGHGFMRDGSDNYAPDAADDAWGKLLAFFAEHLGAPTPAIAP